MNPNKKYIVDIEAVADSRGSSSCRTGYRRACYFDTTSQYIDGVIGHWNFILCYKTDYPQHVGSVVSSFGSVAVPGIMVYTPPASVGCFSQRNKGVECWQCLAQYKTDLSG